MANRMQPFRLSLMLVLVAVLATAPTASSQDTGSISRALRNETGLVLPAVTLGERSLALAPAPLVRGAALAILNSYPYTVSPVARLKWSAFLRGGFTAL